MPEIKPDLSEWSRCISVHWSLPVQCVLPCTHRENWHEAWHPETGNRIRYRRSFGTYRTEELRDDDWVDLEIPPPGEVCGEPYDSKPGVFCQAPRAHNQQSWTHRALFEGCRYTWNTAARQEPTREQMAKDLDRVRAVAAEAQAKLQAIKQLRTWKNEDGKWFVFADDLHEAMRGEHARRIDAGADEGAKAEPQAVAS
jgi:hypothetical protein